MKKKERDKGQTIGQLVASEASQRKKRRSVENEENNEPEAQVLTNQNTALHVSLLN